jgi:hypothetical protein
MSCPSVIGSVIIVVSTRPLDRWCLLAAAGAFARQDNLPTDTTVPWWSNRTLRYQFA